MSKLTVVAHSYAKSGKAEILREELLKLVEPTRGEQGCMNYDLHQDDKDPAHFMFCENWETREHWLAHNDSVHVVAYRAISSDLVAEFTLHEMSDIS